MSDIFISHATPDDEIVTRIHDDLERTTGQEMWVDHKDIQPGDNWQDAIELALKECSKMLLVISRQSMSSDEVKAEWRAALTYKHRLLLVIIDDIPLEDIPARLRLLQWVDLKKDYDGGLQKLVTAIKGTDSDANALEFKSALPITGMIDRRLTQTPLRGRDKDVLAIKAALKLTPTIIIGVGGLGKSKLAAEVVMSGDAWQGVIWQQINEYTQVNDVIELLKQHFSLLSPTESSNAFTRLKTQKTLVVLDNAEDVPPTDSRYPHFVRLVNDLLGYGCQVLITSRVDWKALRPVRKLEPSELDATSARQLVLDMGEREGISDLEKDADKIALAAHFHPRLIEWAVELMTELPRSEVISDLKTLKSQDAQEAMQSMVGKTLERLIASGTAGEQAMAALKRLVVCRGGFTLDAAKAIVPPVLESDDVRNALTTLMTWQFIRFDQQTQRYDLPQAVITALTPDADATAHHPHFDYYKALARQYERSADHEKYLKLDIEFDNLEVAFEWAMTAEKYKQAFWLVTSGCTNLLVNRGRPEQLKRWLERIAAAVSGEMTSGNGGVSVSRQPRDNQHLAAAVQLSLGILYQEYPLGDRHTNLKQSIAAYETALGYFKPQYTPLDYALTQNNLGITYSKLAKLEERGRNLRRAVAAFESALVYYTPHTAPLQYAATQNNLGVVYSDLAVGKGRAANLRRAVAAYEAALVYFTSQSNPLNSAITQNNLGSAWLALAELENREANLRRAMAAYEMALVYYTSQSAPLEYATTQRNLGMIQQILGDIPVAISCWREAERYYRQMGYIQNADLMLKWIVEAEAK